MMDAEVEVRVSVDASVPQRVRGMLAYMKNKKIELELGGYLGGKITRTGNYIESVEVRSVFPIKGFEDGTGGAAHYDMSVADQERFITAHDPEKDGEIVGWWHTHPGGCAPSGEDRKSNMQYKGDGFLSVIFSPKGEFSVAMRFGQAVVYGIAASTMYYLSSEDSAYCDAMAELYEKSAGMVWSSGRRSGVWRRKSIDDYQQSIGDMYAGYDYGYIGDDIPDDNAGRRFKRVGDSIIDLEDKSYGPAKPNMRWIAGESYWERAKRVLDELGFVVARLSDSKARELFKEVEKAWNNGDLANKGVKTK